VNQDITDRQLRDFIDGRLDDQLSERMARLIEDSPELQNRLATMDASPLLKALRKPSTNAEAAREPEALADFRKNVSNESASQPTENNTHSSHGDSSLPGLKPARLFIWPSRR
jgi:anti-sigma factor RsiW